MTKQRLIELLNQSGNDMEDVVIMLDSDGFYHDIESVESDTDAFDVDEEEKPKPVIRINVRTQ